MRCRSAIVAVLWACPAFAPAWGEQPASAPGLWQPLSARPPADTGKPTVPAPNAAGARDDPAPCVPALPCGTRLLGTVRKNGAVELQVPALRW